MFDTMSPAGVLTKQACLMTCLTACMPMFLSRSWRSCWKTLEGIAPKPCYSHLMYTYLPIYPSRCLSFRTQKLPSCDISLWLHSLSSSCLESTLWQRGILAMASFSSAVAKWVQSLIQFTYVVMYQLLIVGTCEFSVGGSGRWFWISTGCPRRGSIHRPAHNGVQCFPHHFHEGLHACGCVAGAEIRLWASGGAPPLCWGAGSSYCWRDIPNPSKGGSTSISAVINIRL